MLRTLRLQEFVELKLSIRKCPKNLQRMISTTTKKTRQTTVLLQHTCVCAHNKTLIELDLFESC